MSEARVPTTSEIASIYDRLAACASRYLSHERKGHTLQTVDLVNEACLKLLDHDGPRISVDRSQLFAIASTQMRRVLRDHALARGAAKRGGKHSRITLHDELLLSSAPGVDFIDLDGALTKLEEAGRSDLVKTVELRFLAGLAWKEVALATGVSEATVRERWRAARAWLRKELGVRKD